MGKAAIAARKGFSGKMEIRKDKRKKGQQSGIDSINGKIILKVFL
jgi:hypothetical protein